MANVKGLLDNVLHSFAEAVSVKYNINLDDLVSKGMYPESQGNASTTSTTEKRVNKGTLIPVNTTGSSDEEYRKKTVPELKKICRERNLSLKGLKKDLIDRLLEDDQSTPSEEIEKSSRGHCGSPIVESKQKSQPRKDVVKPIHKEIAESKQKSQPRKGKSTSKKECLNTVRSKIVQKSIHVNKWGNYEDVDTKLVFEDPNNPTVIGVQEDDGKIRGLKDDDIILCKQYDYQYTLPINLPDAENDISVFYEDE